MGTFYFIIVFIIVFAFYAYCNIVLKQDLRKHKESEDEKDKENNI